MRSSLFESLRLVKSAVQPVLAVVRPLTEQIDAGTLEGPQTAAEQVNEAFSGAIATQGRPIGEAWKGVFGAACSPKLRPRIGRRVRAWVERNRKKLETDPRAIPLLEYLTGLERELPGITCLVAARTVWPYMPALISFLHLHWGELRYRREKGEGKAQALKALIQHATEDLHQRLLIPLDMAERLRRGYALEAGGSYGKLVRDLRGWAPALGSLVPKDAARWRNAVMHLNGWSCWGRFETIQLRNFNPHGKQVWETKLPQKELAEQLNALLESCGLYVLCLGQVVIESILDFCGRVAVVDWLAKLAGVDTGLSPDDEEVENAFLSYLKPLEQRLQGCSARPDGLGRRLLAAGPRPSYNVSGN